MPGSFPSNRARPAATSGGPAKARPRITIRKRRLAAVIAVVALALLIAWPIGLLIWANGKIQHTEALTGAKNTAGTTYLIAGSDARGDGISEDGTPGARTDTIMVLQKPSSGPTALISLPRDTYTVLPDGSAHKLNAVFAGGPKALVTAVESLTGLTVDHYVEVGFGGVEQIVNALNGVELCYDADVNDEKSELVWTHGCHVADGHTALAFSRMRYSDPKGDVGRAERQRQVIGAIGDKAANPSILFRPSDQVSLADSSLSSLTTDEDASIIDLGKMALAFRAASGPDGITGTPPISDPGYHVKGLGLTVRLDPDLGPKFWTDIRDGKLPAGQVGGLPG